MRHPNSMAVSSYYAEIHLKVLLLVGVFLRLLPRLEHLEAVPAVSSPALLMIVSKSCFSVLLFTVFLSAFQFVF